ncbi:hypothetical protein EPYR_02067 [Erwinia pyrifoliae DSM 12163]|nr:phospho-2-dehydro-3-deoxyheptonate aldolase [Erwinia pyrifoliae]CAY74447.1 hypothetical protein EPYR_02067 [Erwinia pyrifoliae DSM 12163]
MPLIDGQSITGPCLGGQDSAKALPPLACAVDSRF